MTTLQIQQNIPLAEYSTFKIGGPAEFFIEVKEKEELIEAFKWAAENNQKTTVLAGGSNVLIADRGIKGLVIKLDNNKFVLKGERVECGAGASLINISRFTSNNNLAELEWAIGVPGTIGGAVRGNAGAYGHYISDTLEIVEVFDREKLEFKYISKKECEFEYKESIFKKNVNLLIWQVTLKLKKGDINEIRNQLEIYTKKREESQPRLPSAGCVFKNINFNYLQQENSELAHIALDKKIIKNNKVSAAWLIDLMGFKGRKNGNTKISLEHANFIVNTGRAQAQEVAMLIYNIKKEIKNKYNIELEEEIQYLS